MNPLSILKAEWRRSWQGMLALALLLGLSVSLGLALSMLEHGIRQGAAHAADDFDLLVGAPGSPTQLLLSTVYLQAQPLPLLAYETLECVAAAPGVVWAAPLAFGDRWEQFPLVGTSSLLPTLHGKRPLAEGKTFAEHDEAVVGAAVPLGVGDAFTPVHGRIVLPDGDLSHDHTHFTVVGRMPPTGTPWDRAILVPLEAVWEVHGLHNGDAGAGISALVVKPRSVADAYKLRSTWHTSATQALFTGEALTDLFATLGDVRTMMQSMAALAQGIALGGVILATLFAVALRRDTLSLLRTLGAPRAYLMASIWGMAGCVVIIGVLLGIALGLFEAHVAATLIEHKTATVLPLQLTSTEWRMAGIFTLTGLAAAGIPTLSVYRGRA